MVPENASVHGKAAESRRFPPRGGFFHSVKGGSLWTAGVYEVLSLSWRHSDTHRCMSTHIFSLLHSLYNCPRSRLKHCVLVLLPAKRCLGIFGKPNASPPIFSELFGKNPLHWVTKGCVSSQSITRLIIYDHSFHESNET